MSEKMQQLQILEQNLQQFLMQKQQFQQQMIEIESALNELQNSKESFKIIGNVMLSANKEDLTKELTTKKEELDLRIKTLEKQEDRLKEKSQSLRDEVMKEMEKNGKD